MKQKALRFIHYGESSPEAYKSLSAIGTFYLNEQRPESAQRHFLQAKKLESNENIPENDKLEVTIGLAESYFETNISKSEETLKPIKDINIEDQNLNYRKEILLGKIYLNQEKFEESLQKYELSINIYSNILNGNGDSNLGHLLYETSEIGRAHV